MYNLHPTLSPPSSVLRSFIPSQMGLEKSYVILCKAFDHEAKAILEVRTITFFSVNNNVVTLNSVPLCLCENSG